MNDLHMSVTYDSTGSTTIRVDESTTPTEFEKFQELAGKLIQVPKAELDEKLKEHRKS